MIALTSASFAKDTDMELAKKLSNPVASMISTISIRTSDLKTMDPDLS
jgi:hypothetical protein